MSEFGTMLRVGLRVIPDDKSQEVTCTKGLQLRSHLWGSTDIYIGIPSVPTSSPKSSDQRHCRLTAFG